MTDFLKLFQETLQSDFIVQICLIFIGISLLIGIYGEFRLSNRYKQSLTPWEKIRRSLELDEISTGARELHLIERFFIIAERDETVIRLSKSAGKTHMGQSLSEALPRLPTSPHRFFPALLTSLGVLGTFSGITVGLSQFDPAGDSSALMSSVSGLLEGMKSAFWTSIIGLLTGAGFMLFLWFSQRTRQKMYNSMLDRLTAVTMPLSPTALLYRMSPEAQNEAVVAQLKAAQAMVKSNESLAATMEALKAGMSELSAEKISTSISGAIKSVVVTELRPTLEEIPRSLSKVETLPALIQELKDIKQDNNEKLIQFLMTRIKEDVVAPVMEQTTKTSEAIQTSTASVNTLSSSVETVIQRLGDTTETLNNFQQTTMERLEGFADSLKDILEEFQQNTEQSLEKITGSISDAMKTAETGMSAQREAFEESAQKASRAFEDQNETLKTIGSEINLLMQSTFERVSKSIEETMETAVIGMEAQRTAFEGSTERATTAFEVQNDTLKSVGEKAAELMEDAKQNLLGGLGAIDDKIKSMSSTVQKELEVFRTEYQANLEAFFRQQEDMLEETLGKQRDGLITVVDKFKATFEQENEARAKQLQDIVEINENLSKSADRVKELVKTVGLTESAIFDQLESAARSVSAQTGKLQTSYEQAQKSFSELTENLPKAMDSYFTKANDHSDKFFENFDDAAAKVHNELVKAAHALVLAMQQINLGKADDSEVGG